MAGLRAEPMRTMLLLPLVLILTACSREDEGSSEHKACVANLYSTYNPKDINQCINACIECDRGVMTTCSTSCRLKGAR